MALSKTLRSLALFAAFTTAVTCSYNDNNCQQQPMMTSPTPSNLDVRLEAVADKQPPTFQVTITNTHKSSPLTIIAWDAPFDDVTRDSGSYHIQPVSPPGADELKSPGIKVKRKMPVPREDLLEIPAQGHVTRELKLQSRWIPTDGERYKVWAKGRWRGIWASKMEDVTDDDLKSTRGEFGNEHMFETNTVEVTLS